MRIRDLLAASPFLAIDARWLAMAYDGADDFAYAPKQPGYQVVGRAGIISVDGPLMQRAGGYEGYDRVASRFSQALADPSVGTVVLRINSPGGQASGCFEAARSMRVAKQVSGKPVIAYADEHAYSGAYAIASVADKIYLPEAGGVGSVGVISVLEDYSKANERFGVNVKVITSGARKADGHPDVPLTPEAIAREQEVVDHLAGIFASLVGESRNMSKEAVLKLEADTFEGQKAVSAGLADGIATFASVLQRANGEPTTTAGRFTSIQRGGVMSMNDEEFRKGYEETMAAMSMPARRTSTPMPAPVPYAPSASVGLDKGDLEMCQKLGITEAAYLETKRSVQGRGPGSTAPANSGNTCSSALTEEERQICRVTGVSEEDYCKTREHIAKRGYTA
jgi:capsid assembly protease